MTAASAPSQRYDVAIIGGGPGGSTAASILRKYDPSLSVAIFEKERFPREHVGESLLPGVCAVLHEMGAWDKVEAAGFPIKIGASLTWGRDRDRWDFDFMPVEEYRDEPRPGQYRAQRTRTAFQVDRSIYDTLLLRHAQSMGAHVFEETQVTKFHREGDRVTGLSLADGRRIEADHYVDASGAVGALRRAMGVGVWIADELKNIAIWSYWQNADWAVRIGVGATRIQVRSLPWGWMWFIPLGPTRTSLGLVCPANHYKTEGIAPEDLYKRALAEQPEIAALLRNATCEGRTFTTRDWSQLTDRLVGDNWILVGEAAGFADPILSAGMSLTASSARDAAYTILELRRAEHDGAWLRERYNTRHRKSVEQHIRFGQYWYAANSCLTDLQENCRKIARDAGLSLSPNEAWRWLAQGGFAFEQPGQAVLGSFDLTAARIILDRFAGEPAAAGLAIDRNNVFSLDLADARVQQFGALADGRIHPVECYADGAGRMLPLTGPFKTVVDCLKESTDLAAIMQALQRRLAGAGVAPEQRTSAFHRCMQALEGLITDGWVKASLDPKRPTLNRAPGNRQIRSAAEGERAWREAQAKRAGS